MVMSDAPAQPPKRIAIFCKSFAEDFSRLRNLLRSHAQFCPELPLILSIPRADAPQFHRMAAIDSQVQVIFDEDYAAPSPGMHGWLQQQICKLSISRTGLADAYLSVDSDAYLVRPVTQDDFYEHGRKRIVYATLFTKYLPENTRLLRYLCEPGTRAGAPPAAGSLAGFAARLRACQRRAEAADAPAPVDRGPWINELFQVPAATALQPGQILHASLLTGMQAFFEAQDLDLVKLIGFIPWEYNWYGSWAAAARPREVACSVSPILHFASRDAVAHARAHGVTPGKIAARFKIVQMAARHFEDQAF